MRKEVIGNATLYLGDCLEILPTLAQVDAAITDPPYGVGLKYDSHDDSKDGYDEWCREWFAALRAACSGPIAISCGIGNIQSWPRADWTLCWSKPNSMGRAMTGWNTWEPVLVYGKVAGVRTHDLFTVSVAPQSDTGNHPCPKPVGWATEIIKRLTKAGQSVIDPFTGSGTTGVGCMETGRAFVGIEKDAGYFDIACKRIEDAQRQERLFA